ncbi:hypothetical protein HDU67_001598 [Dinochytrium kinnereticum]|nr:hypothetical protein HDU67_001598 [Dinochytrium kinnereticum]
MAQKGVYGTSVSIDLPGSSLTYIVTNQGDTAFRRTWNRAEFLQKAAEKEELDRHPGNDTVEKASCLKLKGKGKRQRDEPDEAPKSLLKPREETIDFNQSLNKTQVVQVGLGLLGQPGFHCKVCNIVVKDNANYLDHINGEKHQKNLGMSMKVERSTADQVKARLERLSQKKEVLDPAEEFKRRVKEAQEREKQEKEQKKEDKRKKKKQRQDEIAAQQDAFMDPEIAKLMGFGYIVMVVIPDLAEAEDEEMITTVASPPSLKVNRVKTIRELDTDLASSGAFLNDLSFGGVDLSYLSAIALCPPELADEEDKHWDWDVLFTELAPEFTVEQDVAAQ